MESGAVMTSKRIWNGGTIESYVGEVKEGSGWVEWVERKEKDAGSRAKRI